MGMCGDRSMDEHQPRRGRPYGGVAIKWPPTLYAIVKEIQCDHERVCGVLIYIVDQSILVINAYTQYDNRVEDANYYEYIDVINEIEQLLCRHKADHTILGGDLNTDFSRVSSHTACLQSLR